MNQKFTSFELALALSDEEYKGTVLSYAEIRNIANFHMADTGTGQPLPSRPSAISENEFNEALIKLCNADKKHYLQPTKRGYLVGDTYEYVTNETRQYESTLTLDDAESILRKIKEEMLDDIGNPLNKKPKREN